MSNLNDAQVYARQLLPKRHGYPLWVPEPYGNSVTYRTKGVRIGDVGYVTEEGAFETLFNVRASPDDPVNWRGVPEGFKRLHIPIEDIVHIANFHQPGSTITSASTKKQAVDVGVSTPDMPGMSPGASASFQYTWTSSQGAVLHLPDGACRLSCPAELFRDVATRGAKGWYKFANVTLRRGVPNGALYLVTGCDKAQSWMVGAFSNRCSDTQASFKLTPASVCDTRISYSYSWETSAPAVFRTGPSPPSSDSIDALRQHSSPIAQDDLLFSSDVPGGNTQCIFVRGYRIMLRTSPVSMLLRNSPKVEVNPISSLNPKDIAQAIFERRHTDLSTFAISREHSKSDVHQAYSANLGFISPQSEESLGDSTILEYLPITQEVNHPSMLINEFLLHMCPQALVSVVHDDEWNSLIRQDDDGMPPDSVLLSRMLEKYLCVDWTPFSFLLSRNHEALQYPSYSKYPIIFGPNVPDIKEHQSGEDGKPSVSTDSHSRVMSSTHREANAGSTPVILLVRQLRRPRTAPARLTGGKEHISWSIRREKSLDFRNNLTTLNN